LNYQVFGYDSKKNKYHNDDYYIQLPLNPLIKIKRVKISKCSIPSNKKIILTFIVEQSQSINNNNNDNMISVIFKYGDDLKYDVLTTNLLSIIDILWLKNNLDLKMKTYSALQTGSKTGFISIIQNSKQIKNAKFGLNSIFSNSSNNNDNEDLKKNREFYARSCAGYCVATWILGISLNKNNAENIMIHNNGSLFYINFGSYILNRNKNRNRNRNETDNHNESPFLFTNYMKYPLNKEPLYSQFIEWLFKAYCLLRNKYKLFLNLLLLMVPELIHNELDILFLKNALRFDLQNEKQILIHIKKTLKLCQNDKVNNQIL